jgi:hypothetical protein
MAEDATVVQQVEVDDLESILGVPGGDNVIVPEGEKQNNIFSKSKKVDTSFIDKTEEEEVIPPAGETPEAKLARETAAATASATKKVSSEELDDLLKDDLSEDDDTSTAGGKRDAKTGRPGGAVELTKKLIEKKLIVPFDDGKAIEDYTIKDFEELLEANITDRENQIRANTPLEFFDSLPEELQVAAKYHADGGKDMKGLFRVLSEVEETRALDPDEPKDQEAIVRQYLRATRFGTEEDIDEEITDWKDQNKLGEKSLKFKPKLDAMQEQVVAQKLAAQETLSKQQAAASQNYMNSVFETLKPAELNGVKLDKKVQGMLYTGLVQANYPSMSGKPTNLLGHLLEKYQVVEPNHGLIAEALWLLADPDGYRDKIREVGKTAAVEKTVRSLKTAEQQKIASSPIVEEEKVKQRTIARNNDNFFKR